MSASKSKATNSLRNSEKKSLIRFLTLYIAMSVVMITLISVVYYQNQEKLTLADYRATLDKYAYIQTKRLKVLHHFFDERTEYPRDPRFKSAIYDLEYTKIFSLIESHDIRFDQTIYFTTDGYVHFVKGLDDFYLGTKYLILEVKDSGAWRGEVWKDILGYGLFFLLLFMFFGLFLAKLFLKPMRNAILLLDRFIKDTTHELNTPLSAILANIEMMDTEVMVEKNKTKLSRITIAAKTVSVLYQDLTYLMLEQEKAEKNETIDMKELIETRVEYFSVLLQSKQLQCECDLEHATLYADKRKITRVIDNLISNAIKYNRRQGIVGIRLRMGELTIWDTGRGMDEEKIPLIFDRYQRFDNSEGGFGIGLSIVKQILDSYAITIHVTSKKGKGTQMVLRW